MTTRKGSVTRVGVSMSGGAVAYVVWVLYEAGDPEPPPAETIKHILGTGDAPRELYDEFKDARKAGEQVEVTYTPSGDNPVTAVEH